MLYFTTQQIGPKRHLTPEGYLVCEEVPIARTGSQDYLEGEVPVPPGPNGIIVIERNEDQVFRPETLASANGKDLVDDHPMVDGPDVDGWDVNPTNWKEFTRGVLMNPRRGEGSMTDWLMGDIIVKDASTIQAVLDGKVEVSCGYNADYETLGPGRGRQHNILINHVALVRHGRCGPTCSIGDADMTRMRDELKRGTAPAGRLAGAMRALDGLVKSWKTGDETAIVQGMSQVKDELVKAEGEGADIGGGDEGGSGGSEHHVHVHLNGAAGESKDADPAGLGLGGAGGSAESGDPMEVLASRVAAIEATLTKLVPAIQKLAGGSGGGEDPVADEDADAGEGADEEEGDGDELTTDAAPDVAEGDVEEDNPVAAATGDKKTKDAAPKKGAAPKSKVRDSGHLQERFDEVVARAEYLVPGVQVPTFDAKLPAGKTLDSICRFRRSVLTKAWGTDDGKTVIKSLYHGDLKKNLGAMTCDGVSVLFNGATELARVNNNITQVGSGKVAAVRDSKSGPATLRDINLAHREYWNQPKR